MHFTPTKTAATALRREAVDETSIYVVGNTVVDALQWMQERIKTKPAIVSSLEASVHPFKGRRIIGVTCHRHENLGENLQNITDALIRIARRDDIAIILPVHPNPAISGLVKNKLGDIDNISLIDPLDYPNFVHLLKRCDIILTDSGGVQEEAPTFGTPVLILRDTTERPEAVEAGTARLIGTDSSHIVAETFRLLDDKVAYSEMACQH